MAKKERKPRKPVQGWKLYEIKGGSLTRKAGSCPKCGPSVFLARHSDRTSCGRCGYTEMSGSKHV